MATKKARGCLKGVGNRPPHVSERPLHVPAESSASPTFSVRSPEMLEERNQWYPKLPGIGGNKR
ncbi:uncharacterized protein N7483_008244 [Penicillium malachiteum]|uniref:uncharacterized protein n=1 Tax=Penicillium malachiteum TaxID=1324776 RepID=UPI0025476F58|nr:uncharacterized protein N7483_008244 [Penicillium malachiteum]KAJ5720310.1 hypothetical protein N7483_008244 [Penicillium malachiteum]